MNPRVLHYGDAGERNDVPGLHAKEDMYPTASGAGPKPDTPDEIWMRRRHDE